MRLFSTFGRLPGTWTNLLVMLASGLAEGVGIAMFVPLLQALFGDGGAERGAIGPLLDEMVRLGLPTAPEPLLAAIGALVFGSLALGYVQRKMLAWAKHRYAWRLRDLLVGHLFAASWEHAARQSHGEIVNDLITECGRAGNALGYELMAVATAVQIAVYVAFSGIVSWELMLVSVGFALFVALVVRPLLARAKALGEASNQANREITADNVDCLRGLKLIKAMAGEPRAFARIAERNRTLFEVVYRSEVNASQIYYLVQALPVALLLVVIAVGHGVFALPAPAILVFLVFLVRIAPRIAQFQQMHQSYLLTAPAVAVVEAAIDAARSTPEDPRPDGVRFEHLTDGIVMDRVSYRFPDGEAPVLKEVSLAIGRNRMVAIVGVSGAGKSTLIDLLVGLRRPQSGRILIDGTDLERINLASWRRRIGVVTQDTVIFNDTLRANLLFLRPEATAHDLEEALRVAQLEAVVKELPEGLDTVLGENGIRLSGGQRQRVALARALVGRPDLLILDEATSALDNESERAVQRALESLAHRMTIVVIAHRLSTVRRADTIYVLDGGRIVESGAYETLLVRGGRFTALHESQFD